MLTETGQALTRAGSASKRRLRGAAAGALMALTLCAQAHDEGDPRDLWEGYVYPDAKNLLHAVPIGYYSTSLDCGTAAWAAVNLAGLDETATYECGKNCRTLGGGTGGSDDLRICEEVFEHPPVDGALMLSDIAAFVRRHVWIDERSADALALWAVMTWIHERLEISTFANLTSATKRCGKSLLVEVLHELVYRPVPFSGQVTAAVLFRMVEAHAPTLMLDEADTYIREDETLRGVVNGSQRRRLAYIWRCVENGVASVHPLFRRLYT